MDSGCWGIILGTWTRPLDPETTGEDPSTPAYKEAREACELWDLKNSTARRIIMARLEPEVWENMASDVVYNTAHVVWNWLESHYTPSPRSKEFKTIM